MTKRPRRHDQDAWSLVELEEPGTYDSSRFWTYPRDRWDPMWPHKWGWPSLGYDEWGRQVVVIGFWFLGYVCWAFRTCWCQNCHETREQTYRIMNENWAAGDCEHSYRSTACFHGFHKRCGVLQHKRGDLGTPHCKYCPSKCNCTCHRGWRTLIDKEQLLNV